MLTGENWWAWVLALLAGVGVAAALMLGTEGDRAESALERCKAERPEWAQATVDAREVLHRADELAVQPLGSEERTFTVCEGIAQRWLWRGMTEAMADRSWGPPHSFARSVEADGDRVVIEWLYDPTYMRAGGARLRFVDGHLEEWTRLP